MSISPRHARGRGCRPGRRRSARGPARRTRRAARRSPPGRPGTRSRRRPAASTSASTASKAGRLPCTSESSAIRMGLPLLSAGWGRPRLPLAILVAVAAAAAATFLLRPRSGLIDPPPSTSQAYFTASQLDRAEDFRDLQRLLGLGGLGDRHRARSRCSPGARRERLLDAPRAAPAARRGAAAGAGISLLLVVVGLPLARLAPRAGGRRRASPPSPGPTGRRTWPKSARASSAVFAAIGGPLRIALVRRFRAPLVGARRR